MSSKSVILFAILIVNLSYLLFVDADQQCTVNLTPAEMKKHEKIITKAFGKYLTPKDIIYAKRSKDSKKVCIKGRKVEKNGSVQECSLSFSTAPGVNAKSWGCVSASGGGNAGAHSYSSATSSSHSH